jgi:hypothetical protein
MNVPVSTPPPEVNGFLVSGFLAPALDGATYPPELRQRLERHGYRIDIDPWKARESLDLLFEDLDLTLRGRVAGGEGPAEQRALVIRDDPHHGHRPRQPLRLGDVGRPG